MKRCPCFEKKGEKKGGPPPQKKKKGPGKPRMAGKEKEQVFVQHSKHRKGEGVPCSKNLVAVEKPLKIENRLKRKEGGKKKEKKKVVCRHIK